MSKQREKEKQRGRVIKLSKEVANFLSRKRLDKKKESFDSVLRRHFGLPSRKGEPQALRTYFILDTEEQPLAFREAPEARGFAIIHALRKKRKKADRVIEVREIP